MSLRTKLTLITSLVTAVVLSVTGFLLYSNFRSEALDTLDENLRARGNAVVAIVERSGTLAPGDRALLLGSSEAYFQVVFRDGSLLNSWPELADSPLLPPEQLGALRGPRYVSANVPTDGGGLDSRLLALPSPSGPVVLVGSSLEDTRASLARLGLLLSIGGAVALALTTAAAWALAGAALRPVERMRSEAAAITAGKPGRRLPVPDTGDEIARLGTTLNAMLTRLEEAFEREHRFVDDASHELRTPLGILRTELDLALRRSRTKEELEAALRSAAEQSERLNRLAEDLLVLARADRGLLPVQREPVNLGELCREVALFFQARASESGVTMDVDAGPAVEAPLDPMRVRQAVDNLVDNALRHTPRGGSVRLAAERSPVSVMLVVTDTGGGFPEDFLPHAFEPFWRPDDARTRAAGGAGLGLSIVRAIAEAHGGRVQATNRAEGGAAVMIELPVHPEG